MTEKTTEEVVVSEANEKQPRRKPAARKAPATRKKAAKKEEAVEPAKEVVNEAPAKKTAQRRGRKTKEKANEAATKVAETSDIQPSEVIVEDPSNQKPVVDVQAEDNNSEGKVTLFKVVADEADTARLVKVDRIDEADEKNLMPDVKKEEPEAKPETSQPSEQTTNTQHPTPNTQQKVKPIPPFNPVRIDSIVDMVNAPKGQLLLNDQQIQQLTVDEAVKRFRWIEGTLAWVLNYDVVISDTNIWLELLVGHTSSHSDPKVNARLMFERQLEFISKLVRFRGGRFMMMSETYEEIDRFATQQAPTNYKEADFTDEALCRNVSARLAKRLILSQLRENRLKIEGICAESHHASFADPAIIRKTVELFSVGKRVLLLTNDASVAIRSMGMCDDLQRINNIDDDTWERIYAPLRPMVITMDDLKVLDLYTRQYHFLQMAAGKQWMEDVPQRMEKRNVEPLDLWLDGFRPGDKQSEMHKQQKQQNNQQKQQNQAKQEQQKKQQNQNQQKQAKQQKQQEKAQEQAEQKKQQPQPKQQPDVEQPKVEPKQEKAKIEDEIVEVKFEDAQTSVAVEEAPAPIAEQSTEEGVEQQPKQQRRRPQRRRPQQRKRPQQPQAPQE